MALKKLLFSLMLSSMLVSAHAIKCYQCNSLTHPECQNLADYKPHLTAVFYKECIDNDVYNGTMPFCRKTVLRIMFPENTQRTIRSCGWIKSHLACYKADNEDHLESNCQCFDDGCNGANHIKEFRLIGSLSLGTLLFVIGRFNNFI